MPRTILRLPTAGETYYSGGNTITIKLSAGDTAGAFGCLELTVPPGGGSLPHRHRHEEEFLFVTEGELTFSGDIAPRRGGPETAVYIPRHALHGFENRTTQPARLLSWFFPGGFEGYFREMGVSDPNALLSFEEYRARAPRIDERFGMVPEGDPDFEPAVREAVCVGREVGERFDIEGDPVTLLIVSSATGNSFCAFLREATPGAGIPPHLHFREDETFFVMEGELTAMLPDGQWAALPAGSLLHLPKGAPHAWFNRSERSARFLVVATPGGFDGLFRNIHHRTGAETIVERAARHGVAFLPG
ncbi:MAG: cupin domain-containing protein [Capsulimonadales bacterium]|nr:cupin domain-containing protein [Capsulimonadales bacterium]